MTDEVDVVVVGMGPGGEALAGQLAEAGLQVVGIDAGLVGGECPYYGCIPSKMIVRAANSLAEARRVPLLAGDSTVRPSFAPVAVRVRDEATDNWNDQVAVDRFTGKGGRFIRGLGRLAGSRTVAIGDRRFTARRAVVLDTGTDPAIPPIPGLAGTPYWTNRDAVAIESLPSSLIVLGGGAVGVELAQAFARFGARVTILEAADRILPMEEPDASSVLEQVLADEGLVVRARCAAESVSYDGTRFAVTIPGGSVAAERLLVAVGRTTNLAALGLESIGLDGNARFVNPDGRMRIADGVYAIGDITGKGAYTHISMYQAAIAARHILGQDGPPATYRAVPRVTFTDPEIGAVGLTEAQAREDGIEVRTAVTAVPSSARGWIHHVGNAGVVKLVEDAGRGVLIGATSAGPAGGEVLSALAVAVHAEVPVAVLRRMIFAYPTFHRAIEDALTHLT